MQNLHLRGRVISGRSEGSEFIKLQWVRKQIREKLGFDPYLGTLNMRLTQGYVKLVRLLTDADGIEIVPAAGFCQGKLFKACLMGRVECAVVVPKVASYPRDVVEIIASMNLRKKLHLADGDHVDLKIML